MADKIVSWGGVDSKGTSGMGVTGSLAVSGSATITNGATVYNNIVINTSNAPALDLYDSLQNYTWRIFTNGASFFIRDDGGNNTFSITTSRNITIGPGTSNAARLTVKGSGTTSSTTALLVQNANASASLAVLDNRRVAIGTGSAEDTLQVYGNVNIHIPNTATRLKTDSSGGYVELNPSTNQWGQLTIATGTGASTDSQGPMIFNVQGNEAVRIVRSGKVGIGTSTPSASLHISGASSNVLLEIDSPTQNNILYVSGSGNVGINMASSTYALHVAGPSFNTFATNAPFLVDTSANNYRIANIINNPGYNTGGYANNTFDIFSVGANTTSSSPGNGNPFFRVNLAGGNSTGYYGAAGQNQVLAQLNSTTTSTLVASAQGGGIAVIGGTSTATVTTIAQGSNLNLRSDINGAYAGGGINYFSSINGSQHSHVWYHNATEQMRLMYTGNLLLGTATGSARLTVRGSGTTTSTTTFLLQNSNGTQLGYVDDSGRWQIGQGTNSGYALEVSGSTQITSASGGYKLTLKTTGGGNGAGLLVDQNGYTMFDVNASDVYMRNFPSNTAKLDFWCWNNYGGPTNVLFAQNSQYHVSLNSPDNYKIPIVKFPDATVPIIMGNIATSAIRGYLTVGGAFYASASLGASQRIVSTVSAIANNDTLIGLDILPTFSTGSYTGVTSLALRVSGSATISSILTLTPQDPLPSGVPTGSFAVSSSAPPKPYFYDGTTWNALY